VGEIYFEVEIYLNWLNQGLTNAKAL
jgi:hypothetical protein